MIIARGTKNKKRMTVEYDDGRMLFDGVPNLLYEADIEYELKRMHPVAGSFFPESETDPLNIINVLRVYFFDSPQISVNTDEDFELPYEEGVVY